MFLRKSILNLARDNRPYKTGKFGPVDDDPILKQFLAKVAKIDGDLTATQINDILDVLCKFQTSTFTINNLSSGKRRGQMAS